MTDHLPIPHPYRFLALEADLYDLRTGWGLLQQAQDDDPKYCLITPKVSCSGRV